MSLALGGDVDTDMPDLVPAIETSGLASASAAIVQLVSTVLMYPLGIIIGMPLATLYHVMPLPTAPLRFAFFIAKLPVDVLVIGTSYAWHKVWFLRPALAVIGIPTAIADRVLHHTLVSSLDVRERLMVASLAAYWPDSWLIVRHGLDAYLSELDKLIIERADKMIMERALPRAAGGGQARPPAHRKLRRAAAGGDRGSVAPTRRGRLPARGSAGSPRAERKNR